MPDSVSTGGERTIDEDEHGKIVLGESHVALRLPTPQRVLSFAPFGGGFVSTRLLAICEVRNADLPLEVDPEALLAKRMRALGGDELGVGMLTSRSVSALEVATCSFQGLRARAAVTCGLSNALRAGDPPGPLEAWGTINIIVQVSAALSDIALIEALSIAAEARTSAVVDAQLPSRRSGLPATGTGTDCIAVVSAGALAGAATERYAGKHTRVGHVIGHVVRDAVERAVARWKAEHWPAALRVD